MNKSLIFLFPLIFLLSCEENGSVDCSTALCEGPSILVFEVLRDGQNIFDENSITPEDISIIGTFPNTFEVQLQEATFGNTTARLLFIDQIDWSAQTYDFNLMIGMESSPNLSVTIALSTGNCCAGIPQVSQFEVNGLLLENPNQVVTINL